MLSITALNFQDKKCTSLIKELSPRLAARSDIFRSLKKTGKWEGEFLSNSPDIPNVSTRIMAAPFYNASGELTGIRGTIIDTSKETELANVLRFQASHDELTGLVNRRELNERLTQKMAEYHKDGTPFSLVTLDLDRFQSNQR